MVDDKREDKITVRLTTEEKLTIEQKAKKRGLLPSTFLRMKGLEGE